MVLYGVRRFGLFANMDYPAFAAQIICKFALLPDGCPHGWLIDWTSSQAGIATLLLQIIGKVALRMISIAQNTQIMLYLQLG